MSALVAGPATLVTWGQENEVQRAILRNDATPGVGDSEPIATNMKSLDGERQLMIADVLSFQILEDGDSARRIIVTDSAEVDIPYIGRLKASGRSCKELAFEIKKRLEKEYYHQATVIVGLDYNAYGSRNLDRGTRGGIGRGIATVNADDGFTMMGQIAHPGIFPLRSGVPFKLSHAILQCGGFQKFANNRRVRVLRRDSNGKVRTIAVNVREIMDKGRLDQDIIIKKGDVIIVDKKLLNF